MTLSEAYSLIQHADLTRPLTEEGQAAEITPAQHWADLGSGSGLFTRALSRLLPTSNGVHLIPRQSDFIAHRWELPLLDGILMANSLHYVRDKPAFLEKAKQQLTPGAPFLIVEYDTDIPAPVPEQE